MSALIIAFTGISGVGKTTFLRSLAKYVSFQHLTGGSLISAGRQATEKERDTLRHANLDENQRLLLLGFAIERDHSAQLIVMDGHVVIDTDAKLEKLSIDVFRELEISMMVHLEADPALIEQNRKRDKGRNRPTHSIEVLSKHQQVSRRRAEEVAVALGVECIFVSHERVQEFGGLLAQRLSKGK